MKALILAARMLRRNRRSHLLILIIAITIAFTASFSCIQNMLWDAYLKNKGNVFGNFSHLSYTKANEEGGRLLEYLEERIFPQEKASISIMTLESNSEKSMIVGEVDDDFIDLSGIKLIEGRFPNNSDECAISEPIAEYRNKRIKAGDSISIAGTSYTVSGVFQGYGNSWPRSELQIRHGMAPPNIFLDSTAYAQLAKSQFDEYKITLYIVREDLIYEDSILALAPQSFMRNENRVRNLNIFTHSNITYLFVALSLFLVTIGATVLHYSIDRERLQLLDLLGAGSSFKKCFLAAKCFFILLIAFVLSSITILLVWHSVGTWIYSSFGIVSAQSFPPETLSLVMLLLAMTVIMMAMYYTQVLRTNCVAKSTKTRKHNTTKTVHWWRIEFQNMKSGLLLFLIVLSTSGTLMMFAGMTYFRYQDGLEGRSIAFESQLDREFDFAYSVIPINSPYVPLDEEP
ncbi:MAG: ABC transporter permease, partial [Bacillota bacterium]|nr:ABC transporter permease [Bacillota bacterium]